MTPPPPTTIEPEQQSLYEQIAAWCNECGVSLGESEKLGHILDAYFSRPTPQPTREAAEWMDAAANDIGKLFQNRWERAYMEPVMPQEIQAIIARHYTAPAEG